MSSDKTAFIVIGPPGCGKGTRVQLLIEWYMYNHVRILHRITMSDELRLVKKLNRKWYDQHIGRHIEAHRLVPFEDVVRVFDPVFRRAIGAGQSVIVDGFPRDINQARHLLALAEKYPKYRFVVVMIEIGLGDCRERMILRKRPGETFEAINGRLEEWEQLGVPTNDFLSRSNLEVHSVPAGVSPYEGLNNILWATGLLKKLERPPAGPRKQENEYTYHTAN